MWRKERVCAAPPRRSADVGEAPVALQLHRLRPLSYCARRCAATTTSTPASCQRLHRHTHRALSSSFHPGLRSTQRCVAHDNAATRHGVAKQRHPQRHRTALMTVCDSPVHSQNHQRDGTLLVTVLSHRWPIHRHPLPLHPGQCALYHPTTNWCSHSSNPSFVRPCLPVLPAVPLSRCPSVRLCTHRACHCPPEPPAGVAAIAVFVAVAAAAGSVSATAAVGSTQQQLRAGATAGATLPFRFPVPKMRENFAALVDEYYVRAPLAGVRHRLPACHTLKKNLHLTPPSVCRRNPSFSARPPRRLPITVRTTRRHVLFFVCLFSQHFCPARDSFFFFEISFRLFGVFGTSAPRTPSPTLTAVYDTLCLSIQGGPGNP